VAQQSARLTFTGSEPWLEITWPTNYANRRYMRGVRISGFAGGAGIPTINFTVDTGTTLRVEPTLPFVGEVDVVNIELP